MLILVVAVSLMAALVNAVAIIWMRKAAGMRKPRELFSRKLFLAIAGRKLWLASIGLQFVGYILQAVALNFGSIILVEPIMTMVLVFLVLILHYRYGIKVGKTEWFAVSAVCVGLFMMLNATRPHGEVLDYTLWHWAIIGGVVASVISTCIWFIKRASSPTVRATFGGIAVATNIGLTAGLTKLVVNQVHQGFLPVVTHWDIYALTASAVSAAIISQSAFAAGPLVISQPIIEILNPVMSGVIAAVFFKSVISTAPAAIAVAAPGLILTVIGLAVLGSSARFQYAHIAIHKHRHKFPTWLTTWPRLRGLLELP